MQFAIFSPGKAFTDPLFVTVALLLVTLVIARNRTRTDESVRRPLSIALAATTVLALLSTGVAERALAWATFLDVPADATRVRFIVVPNGGLAPGSTIYSGILSPDTVIRLAAAVGEWEKNPAAILLLTGADVTTDGTTDRALRAMAAEAQRRGVPKERIIIEARSTNSREHAEEIARFVARGTPLAVVSNGWHLRRLGREFRSHFDHVALVAADPGITDRTLALNDLIPSSTALRNTTRLLHEWVGLAWYALTS